MFHILKEHLIKIYRALPRERGYFKTRQNYAQIFHIVQQHNTALSNFNFNLGLNTCPTNQL